MALVRSDWTPPDAEPELTRQELANLLGVERTSVPQLLRGRFSVRRTDPVPARVALGLLILGELAKLHVSPAIALPMSYNAMVEADAMQNRLLVGGWQAGEPLAPWIEAERRDEMLLGLKMFGFRAVAGATIAADLLFFGLLQTVAAIRRAGDQAA